MTEESVSAAWYHEHKDDPDFLDNFEVVPPPEGRRRPVLKMQDGNSEPQTEQEWADYYQAHRDDSELWGEPVPAPKRGRGRPSRNMGARISVRFTPEEMAHIRAKSASEGLTYSEVVRRAVLAHCAKTQE